MIHINTSEKKFKLNILGYQYSSSKFQEDLDWLNICISINDSFNEWNAEGPYLRVSELEDLYFWLEKIELRTQKNKRLNFLENELSFYFDDKQMQLVINLDFNFHPKKDKYEFNKDSEYSLSFFLNQIDIKKILISIKNSLIKIKKPDNAGL